MSNDIEGKRISLKRKIPNPLLQTWLEDLLEEAKAKKSKLEPILSKALESIRKYPLPLNSGAECIILEGFDKKLCSFLDRRLEVYSKNQLLAAAEVNSQNSSSDSQNSCPNTNVDTAAPVAQISNSSTGSTDSKKSRSNRKYKPVFRSGSYAILIALLEHMKRNGNNVPLKKDELIELAQVHSEESFTRSKPESFYTAWSSMGKLVNKNLVKQIRDKGSRYSLTEEGILLAEELLKDYQNKPTVNDIFNGATSNSDNQGKENRLNGQDAGSTQNGDENVTELARTTSDINYIDMPAGSFDVILLIDKQETSGCSKKNDPTVAQFKKFPDLKHEYRSLKVGDFTWIARNKSDKDQELVLPHIVERKRMDDLGASIKDGRFHEQKFRLRKCGIKNVLYLVEHYGKNKHVGLPVLSLMQALANTRVQDGFKVHTTDSLTDSAKFLAMMTKRLTIEYKNTNLHGCSRECQGNDLMTFQFFNKSSMKNKPLTVTETFIKLLLQLKGVSVEKALAITKVYPTPKALFEEYDKCNKKEGELLLANLKHGEMSRNVGPCASKTIYQLFI